MADLGQGPRTPGSQDMFFSLEPECIRLYVAWIDYSLGFEYFPGFYFCYVDQGLDLGPAIVEGDPKSIP